MLRTEVPIRTGTWDLTRPGYLEAGRVAHGGASLAGNFIGSLTCTDMASPWTEGRAVWNEGATGVLAVTCTTEHTLPLELLGSDSDHGSEWGNPRPVACLHGRAKPMAWKCSRPCHTDDNARWNSRTGCAPLVEPLKVHCQDAWGPLLGLFLPGLQLKTKRRERSGWTQRTGPARSAYQRLVDPGVLGRGCAGGCASATRAWSRLCSRPRWNDASG